MSYFTLRMLDFFQYHQGVKQFGKVISRLQKLPLAGKDTEQLLDTTFWLNPWLKSISFGSNVYHLAKVLATTNSELR